MADSFVQVTLIGRVGSDAALRYSQAGEPIASFPIAQRERFSKGEERTIWWRVIAFNKADRVAEVVKKGRRLLVIGRPRLNEYEKDGEKRQRLELIVQSWQFMDHEEEYVEKSAPQQAPQNVGYQPRSAPPPQQARGNQYQGNQGQQRYGSQNQPPRQGNVPPRQGYSGPPRQGNAPPPRQSGWQNQRPPARGQAPPDDFEEEF